MRITLLAAGTRGDTQPFVALGLALKRLGADVRVAASETFDALVRGQGLDFYPLGGDVAKIASDRNIASTMQTANPLKIVLSFNKLRTLAAGLQRDFYDACQGSDAVVYHPGAAIGFFAAQHLNIPSILAAPFPMTPTREYPALIFYHTPRLGGRANWLSHKVFEQTLWLTSRSSIRQFWRETFGRVPPDFVNPFGQQRSAKRPTVVGCSPHVFPRPRDWPEHVHATGYWFLDEEGWEPPAALRAFLEDGDPPVYVGFGSMGDAGTAAQTTRLVMEALRRCGRRGVLATGWGGISGADGAAADMFVLEGAPHAWLFPRMAAVVHHGGAGTTAAALRAGVPSVVVPHAVDQFAWGRRVFELGVGSAPVPKRKLTVARLASALAYALGDDVRRTANALGQKLQRENGAEVAARVIINCLER